MKRDVVIVGSGAGGGPLALTLSRSGLDVLVLEKGPRHPREAYRPDEMRVQHRQFYIPDLRRDPHTVVTRKTTESIRTHLGWISTCVGGGTVHMGAYLYRFHPDDFRMGTLYGETEELVDWPFGYDEMEPWYSMAEQEVGMSGRAELNPFEGPRSQPYPLPPLDRHPLSENLEAACRDLNLHPYPTPRAINSRPYQGRPACAYCFQCAGHGCRVGAKGSSQEALIPRAEATGNCEVRAECSVTEILVGPDGRATGCVYRDADDQEHEVEARVVCLSASSVESARLLLNSKSARFPDGLANGNGHVGRHLQFHGVSYGQGRLAYDRHPDLPLRVRHPFLDVSAMDHYFLPEGVSEIAKGGLLRFDVITANPLAMGQEVAFGSGKIRWGRELAEALRRHCRDGLTVGFEVFHDFLPNEGTFVDLDPKTTDAWGAPAARIHLDLPEHHQIAGRWVVERGLEILESMGATDLKPTTLGGTSAYLVHGTCRMGTDPDTSVLDPWCRTHEVPNLYVVDGSFMPTSGGAAPTLTILANSFRVAHHIAGELD